MGFFGELGAAMIKKLSRKKRKRLSKAEQIANEMAGMELDIKKAELQAKLAGVQGQKAQKEAKKTENEWDGIIEKVRGYQDLCDELGIDKEDDMAKLAKFLGTIQGAAGGPKSAKGGVQSTLPPSGNPPGPKKGQDGLFIPQDRIPGLLAKAKNAPPSMVKAELIKMLEGQ